MIVPKVTVLMPVYNTKESHLRETIASILKQTYKDFEFLIINDASTNNVKEVIESYDDARIVYVENEKNLGISASSNLGVALAKGEYIARQDHDDISKPTRLEKEVKIMDENPEIGVCSSFFEMFPKKKKTIFPTTDDDIKEFLVLVGSPICHPASMIRKSVLVDNNIIYKDEYRYAEDYALWVDLLNKTKFCNIPKFLFKYRWFGENASITSADIQRKNAFAIRLNAFLSLLSEYEKRDIEIIKQVYAKSKINSSQLYVLRNVLEVNFSRLKYQWQKNVFYKFYHKALSLTKYDDNIMGILFNDKSVFELKYLQKWLYLSKIRYKSFKCRNK